MMVEGDWALEMNNQMWQIINLKTGKVVAKFEGSSARELAQAMVKSLNKRSRD